MRFALVLLGALLLCSREADARADPCAIVAGREVCNLAWKNDGPPPERLGLTVPVARQVDLGSIAGGVVPVPNTASAAASAVPGVPSISIDPKIAQRAAAILKKLEEKAADENALGEAARIVVACKDKPDAIELYKCSGFFVPSVTRINCLSYGVCRPLAWGSTGVASGHTEWWPWLVYDQRLSVGPIGVLAPWNFDSEASRGCAVNKDGKEATDERFIACMTTALAPEETKRVLKCYGDNPKSPVTFATCVSKTKLTNNEQRLAECVIRQRGTPMNCLSDLAPRERAALTCIANLKPGDSVAKSCPEVRTADKLAVTFQCALEHGGDVSLFGYCLKGYAEIVGSKTLAKLQDCAKATQSANKSLSSSQLQESLLKCSGQGQLAQKAANVVSGGQAIADCTMNNKTDATKAAECVAKVVGLPEIGEAMKTPTAAVTCLLHASTPSELAPCVGSRPEELAKVQTLGPCLSAATDAASKAKCLAGAPLSDKIPQVAAIACVAKAEDAFAVASCAGIKGVDNALALQRCINDAGADRKREVLCALTQARLNKDQAIVVSCATQSTTWGEGASCVAASYLPKDVARAIGCVASSQGSPAGTALCLVAPKMNAEARIAAECAASSGGVPVAFAVCAGGRLIFKELMQCISGGFDAKKGCFGKGNTLVKFFSELDKANLAVLNALGMQKAYTQLMDDIKAGKALDPKTAQRVVTALAATYVDKPAEASKKVAEDAARAGIKIAVDSAKVAQQIAEAQKKVAENFPPIPAPPGPGHGWPSPPSPDPRKWRL